MELAPLRAAPTSAASAPQIRETKPAATATAPELQGPVSTLIDDLKAHLAGGTGDNTETGFVITRV
jgi:hypothetical protein